MNLLQKRVEISPVCTWCLCQCEDEMHVLFTCSFARSVWTKMGLQDLITGDQTEGIVEKMRHIFNVYTREKLAWVAIVCWNLWNRRNKWIWDKVSVSVFGVQSTAANMSAEWIKCQQEKQVRKSVNLMSARRWVSPPQGWVKINVDAAIFEATGSVGLGSVIRDEHGNFVRARSQKIEVQLYPREAEAEGLKQAVSWVKDLGFKHCIFEMDAKVVVDAIKKVKGCAYFHTIVLDCVDLLKHFDNVLVQFVHRSANAVAHTLARAAHSLSGCQEWTDVAPNFIYDVLIIDSI